MSTYSVGKDIQALVADIGSFSTKIGYAGDDHPSAIYNSTTAVVRANNNSDSVVSSNFIKGPKRDFVSRTVDSTSSSGNYSDGNYELVNPIDPMTGWAFSPPSQTCNLSSSYNNNNEGSHNKLGDAWESHELISNYLQHAMINGLGLNSESIKHHPLVLLDKSHTPPAIRQRLLEILFETHDMPAVFFLRDAIAACYAVGKTTATVVDVGYSSTMVTPVYEGFVETRGILRNNACSAYATEQHVLSMMDEIVTKQGGRKRKEKIRRECVKHIENNSSMNSSAADPSTS